MTISGGELLIHSLYSRTILSFKQSMLVFSVSLSPILTLNSVLTPPLPRHGSRERPAAIPIEIKSIDDTSNFDEFPDSDILTPTGTGPFSLKHPAHLLPLLCELIQFNPSPYSRPSIQPERGGPEEQRLGLHQLHIQTLRGPDRPGSDTVLHEVREEMSASTRALNRHASKPRRE